MTEFVAVVLICFNSVPAGECDEKTVPGLSLPPLPASIIIRTVGRRKLHRLLAGAEIEDLAEQAGRDG